MAENYRQIAKSICRASNNIFEAGKNCKRLIVNNNTINNDVASLCDFFDISNKESFLIAALIYNRLSTDDSMSIKDILTWLNLKIDSAPEIQETLTGLYKKDLIGRETNRWERKEPQYFLTPGAYQAVISGKKEAVNHYNINSFLDLLQRVHHLYAELRSDKCESIDFFFQIENLTDRYREMPEIDWLNSQSLSGSDQVILLTSASFAVSNPGRDINVERIIQHTDNRSLQTIQEFTNNTHPLLQKKLLEFIENDFSAVDEMRLSRQVIDGFSLSFKPKSINLSSLKYGTVITPDQITPVEVYINVNEQKQLDTIEKIYNQWFPLSIPKEEILASMKSLKVLMEGPSGVGKTQSVLNFAYRNGLAIYEARASQMKDMWVGSTEKAYEGIFTEFKAVQEYNAEKGVGTVMVINELEGILASRIKSDSSVNFMISSATSIFLKEMEKFRGIMITTCNQSKGFIDEAAYRRFNFKINFEEPSFENRVDMIKSKFPNLNHEFIRRLCNQFKLRGGQVQNVLEKFNVLCFAEAERPYEELIWELCENEINFFKEAKTAIGFRTAC
ncbi:MAG: AAA family ATPase [Bacteroidetes bacterium]|nr:AAA family ATPase [Bacteroidota bacterium]